MKEIQIQFHNDRKKDQAALDAALKELKKNIKNEGLMQELKRREAYMGPSKYRRWKHNEAIKQRKRDEKKQERVSRQQNF